MSTYYSTMNSVVEQPSTTYWIVESPLTEEESIEPLVITAEDLPPPRVDPFRQRMQALLVFVLSGLLLFALVIPYLYRSGEGLSLESGAEEPAVSSMLDGRSSTLQTVPSAGISPIFAPPVQHWAPHIMRWAAEHDLDPDMVATVMQIESCGDPQAVSIAGAQGLFQVMPFHFVAGENGFDPNTNAYRGMAYLAERLVQTSGDAGLAFAGYNGGHVAAASSWHQWAHETQRYYVWSTGIYADAKAGLTQSDTLAEWMSAGGASLCNQAAQRLGLTATN